MEQITHYYPYGGIYGDASTGQGVQPYKYNGKEFDRMHGFDMLDYGARFHDPATGNFTSMDPLCEKYYHLNPYLYCAGNPIRFVDPDGNEVIDGIKNSDDNIRELVKYLKKNDNENTIIIVAHGNNKNFNVETYDSKDKTIINNKIYDGKQFNKFLEAYSSVWKDYKKSNKNSSNIHIILYSCNTADVARNISANPNFRDITFIAPDRPVLINDHHEVAIGEIIDEHTIKYGHWVTIKNGSIPMFNAKYYGGDNLKPGIKGFKYNFTIF